MSNEHNKKPIFTTKRHLFIDAAPCSRTLIVDNGGNFSWDPIFLRSLSDDERLSIEQLVRHGIVRSGDVETFQTITLHGQFGTALKAEALTSPQSEGGVPNTLQAPPAVVLVTPPRLLEKFLWLALPAGLRDAILGDAEESFHDTLRKFRSIRLARWNYFKEVAYGICGAVLMLYARLEGKFKQRQ